MDVFHAKGIHVLKEAIGADLISKSLSEVIYFKYVPQIWIAKTIGCCPLGSQLCLLASLATLEKDRFCSSHVWWMEKIMLNWKASLYEGETIPLTAIFLDMPCKEFFDNY